MAGSETQVVEESFGYDLYDFVAWTMTCLPYLIFLRPKVCHKNLAAP